MLWVMRWTLSIGLFFVIVIAGIALFMLPSPAGAPTVGQNAQKAGLIAVDTPRIGDAVSSPLVISGKARGTWYFEASFPVEIRDAGGALLAAAPAQAQSDWMTVEYVPFYVSLAFPPQPAGGAGTVTLKKDNPSGLPEHDDKLVIPVTFK